MQHLGSPWPWTWLVNDPGMWWSNVHSLVPQRHVRTSWKLLFPIHILTLASPPRSKANQENSQELIHRWTEDVNFLKCWVRREMPWVRRLAGVAHGSRFSWPGIWIVTECDRTLQTLVSLCAGCRLKKLVLLQMRVDRSKAFCAGCRKSVSSNFHQFPV